MSVPGVTVTGNFIDLTGVALNGYCAFSIYSPTGATEFVVAGTGQVVPNRVQTGLGTSFSQVIWGNDQIQDRAGNANTQWNIVCYNTSNQAFWDFNYTLPSINSYNLVSTAPTNPPPTLPAPLNAQTANTVYAGPAGGGPAVPTFRSLAPADLPLSSNWTFLGNNIHSGTETFNGILTATAGGTLSGGFTGTFSTLTIPSSVSISTANAVTLSVTNPAAIRTYTVPDFGNNDSFVGLAATQTLTNKTLTSPVINGVSIPTPNYPAQIVYNTASVSTNAAITATTMATAGGSGNTYRFSFYIDQTVVGSGGTCSTAASITVQIMFTDPQSGSVTTQNLLTNATSSFAFPAGAGTVGSNIYSSVPTQPALATIRAKAATAVQYSTSMATNNCTVQPSYQLYPLLEQIA